MNNLHVKTGDTAIVLSGKEKGKKGKVLSVNPKKGMVVIGIVKREGALRACKVMKVCPKCDKPTRPAHKILENGAKVAVCKHCGAEI